LPELPRALLRIVAVGTGIAIHEVALEHVIHGDGQLARRGRDGLRFPGAGGQVAVERLECRLGPPEADCGARAPVSVTWPVESWTRSSSCPAMSPVPLQK
jgi:hypothetical protein